MAISLVQTTSNFTSSATSLTTPVFGAGNTPGNTIIVAIHGYNGAGNPIATVTDTLGNTYHQVAAPLNYNASAWVAIYYAYNIGSGSNAVTVASANAGTQYSIIAREYSGLTTTDPLDKTANSGTSGNGTTPSSGATATTTQASELVIGMAANWLSYTFTAGSGYGNIANASDAGNSSLGMEDKIVSSTGAQTATFTQSGSWNWGCIVATFKAGVFVFVPKTNPRANRAVFRASTY